MLSTNERLLIDTRHARPLALEAAVAAMAPATRAAITSDLKCFLAWCKTRRPAVTAVPAARELGRMRRGGDRSRD